MALKPKEIKFIKAKAEGKTHIAAAMEATGTTNTGTAAVQASRMIKNVNVQEELAKAFERAGITIDKAVQPIADGLIADQEYYDKNGEQHTKPDHSIRLSASRQAFTLMGVGKSDSPGGQTINNFIILSSEKKAEYGF